jgi:transposase InsO family protein
LQCDVSTGRPRPFLPSAFRRPVFDRLHGLSHPGGRATFRLISQRFVWPGMRKDAIAWSRGCHQCQRSKISRHVMAPLSSYGPPSRRFAIVHLDLVGPLPPSRGYRYLLTAIDRFSRWIECAPLEDMTAPTVARAFGEIWISRFGSPEKVITDQGRQFESALFRECAALYGIQLARTTAYHPACNGMIERVHRTLKAALMCYETDSWSDALPMVLLGMRTQYKEDLEASAAEMLYGEPLRVPGEFFAAPSEKNPNEHEFVQQLRQRMAVLRPVPASRHGKPAVFVYKDLKSCPSVYQRTDAVRRALEAPYTGPFRVLSRDEMNF